MQRTARTTAAGLMATLAVATLALAGCSEKTTTGAAGNAAPAAVREAEPVDAILTSCPEPRRPLPVSGSAESEGAGANFRPGKPRNVQGQHLGSDWYMVRWDAPTSPGPYGIDSYVVTSIDVASGERDGQALIVDTDNPRSTMEMAFLVKNARQPHDVVVTVCDRARASTNSDPVRLTYN